MLEIYYHIYFSNFDNHYIDCNCVQLLWHLVTFDVFFNSTKFAIASGNKFKCNLHTGWSRVSPLVGKRKILFFTEKWLEMCSAHTMQVSDR